MRNLFVEKVNRHYREMTRTNQVSGLSVCIDMIVESLGKDSLKVAIDNLSHIDQAIQRFNPANVILTSIFCTSSDLANLRTRFPSKKFFVMVHSNSPFLAVQGEGYMRIGEAIKNGVTVICNDQRLADSIPEAIHLPNIYKRDFIARKFNQNNDLKVICAGSLRPMKNHITQALASIMYANRIGKKLSFYCNTGRNEGGNTVLMNLKAVFKHHKNHELISLPWLSHSEFVKSLQQFDIGLQVSMSESFNIVAADYTCAGLPMVVSSEISWASQNCFADSGNPSDISKKMETSHMHVMENQVNLLKTSKEAVEKWKLI